MKLDYTLHSHTFRCGHASGDMEDYLKTALDRGFKIYGVSDHVFLPGINHPRMRGGYDKLQDYIQTFKELKEKYTSIPLYLGFEAEYQDNFAYYYFDLLKNKGLDYLICGQHLRYHPDGSQNRYFDTQHLDNYEGIERYKNDVIDAMKSGLFLYIAHPDLFFYNVTKVTPFIEKIVDEIITAALKYNVPLEINLGGTRGSIDLCKERGTLGYPNSYFWEEVSKRNALVVYGGDYHSPSDFKDRDDEFVTRFIYDHNLKLADIKILLKNYKSRIKQLINSENHN